ncbi:unnamed protein product [Rotaria socialis]|uniref:Glycosyl transferase family 25 domain-containing protein n=1 Tax=Rotaria socialis TaxID=392032 RepID=A0A818B5K1_9BILA|nr:unnamed protein product [Rotaria socialis]CAF3449298.1 unnamed protein product [Rotaria socialis]
MVLLLYPRFASIKIVFLCCITLTVLCSSLYFGLVSNTFLSSPLRWLIIISSKLCLTTHRHAYVILPADRLISNLNFSFNHVYHYNGIAYDYYSKNELGQSKPGDQWKIWPLSAAKDQLQNTSSNIDIEISPLIVSKLPFVDMIYVVTNSRLTERHASLKEVFKQQGISMKSIEWRMRWNLTTCESNSSFSLVSKRLNLNGKPLDKQQQRQCPITAEHVDIWYEMAKQKVRLGLILEDDVIFVPFFKEKLTRMIYAAIQSGALRLDKVCAESNQLLKTEDEWIHQNPMFVVESCFSLYGKCFRKHFLNASPLLSTQKLSPSRCTHAYLLTSCSAQALVDQLRAQKNDFLPPDILKNVLFPLSPTLQSFWIDPPLAYQGNQVTDFSNLSTFRAKTYM